MAQPQRIPIVRLSRTLIVTIPAALSETMVDRLQQDVAAACAHGDARGLVVDLSEVEVLENHGACAVRDLAVMARSMGVETVVCGLRPVGATALAAAGLEPSVPTASNLDRALALLRVS